MVPIFSTMENAIRYTIHRFQESSPEYIAFEINFLRPYAIIDDQGIKTEEQLINFIKKQYPKMNLPIPPSEPVHA